MKIYLPRYSEEQYIVVSRKVLPKLKNDLYSYIGRLVFSKGGDIRQVISIGKLLKKTDGQSEVEMLIETMTKYGKVE